MRPVAFAIAGTLGVALSAGQGPVPRAGTAEKVRVYLTQPVRDGWIDADAALVDSLLDIQKRLKDATPVEDRSKADLTLIVAGRGMGTQQYGQFVSVAPGFGGVTAWNTPVLEKDYWLFTYIEIDAYRKPIVGRYSSTTAIGPWGQCADGVVKDLMTWILNNRERLIARRSGQDTKP